MRSFLEEFGLVGSAGQAPVTYACSFAVSVLATGSFLHVAGGGAVTSAPDTPDLVAASDSGSSATDNITNDTTPTFRVGLPPEAIAGNTVRVYRAGSMEIGSTVLNGTDIANDFADVAVLSAIPSSGHTITARVENGAGLSLASAGLAITVDAVAPDAPTGIVVTPADQGSGPLQTENTQPTFRIDLPANAVAGDVATLEIDTVADRTATLTGTDITNGYVDIQSLNVLGDNALYDISAFVTDVAGNEGASSAAAVVEVGTANDIPAVIYDGVQGHLKHTGGPAGAADGPALTVVWAGTFNSDGSAMSLFRVINGNGTVLSLRRTSTNAIEFKGWQSDASTAVFSNLSSAVAASLGFLIILASCTGTAAHLKIIHAAGTITGSNTPGSAGNLDLTANWWFGQDGSAGEFFDADTAMWWADDSFIDFSDSDSVEQFWDTTADLLRDPGNDGSNPVDGTFSPLVCHQASAASHVLNSGTGGDADTAGTFADGTSPGTYAGDFTPAALTLPLVAFYPAGSGTNTGLIPWGQNAGWMASDSPYVCASFWVMRHPGVANPPSASDDIDNSILSIMSGTFAVTSAIRLGGSVSNKWKIICDHGSRRIISDTAIPDDGVPHHVAVSHHLGLTESIINGSFATNSDWVYTANGSTGFAYNTDHVSFNGAAGDQYLEQQTLAANLVEGTRYRIRYTLSNIAGGTITTLVLKGHGAAGADITLPATTGTKIVEWVQGPGNLTKLSVMAVASGVTFDIDTISVANIIECIRIDRAASSVARSGTQVDAPDTTRQTSVGGASQGSIRLPDCAIGEVMWNAGTEWIDFNSDTNLNRVVDTNVKAVDVGANGSGWSPTSTAPRVYLTGSAMEFFKLRGGNTTTADANMGGSAAGSAPAQFFTVPDTGIPIAAPHASKLSTFNGLLPNFNGTSSRFHTLNCSTLTNSKNFSFMLVVNPDRATGTLEYLFDSAGAGFEIFREAAGTFRLLGRNSGGATILDVQFSGPTLNQTAIYHISGTMTSSSTLKVLKNGSALTPTINTYTDDTLVWNASTVCIGATQAGAGWYDGGLGLWAWNAYADLDATAIAKLLTAVGSGGKPNFDRDSGMGDYGETVFGSKCVFATPFTGVSGVAHRNIGTLAADWTSASLGTGDSLSIT